MFEECDYCHEQIELKLCRATPRANFFWYSPVDQDHVYALCLPKAERPTTVLVSPFEQKYSVV